MLAIRVDSIDLPKHSGGFWGRCFDCKELVPSGTGYVIGLFLFCDECVEASESDAPGVSRVSAYLGHIGTARILIDG